MSTAIVRQQDAAVGTFGDVQRIAEMFAMSNYFGTNGTSPVAVAQIVTKIMAGRELGYGPFASVNGIHVIQGRTALGANLMAAAVKASGRYDYRVKRMDADACEIEFFERIDGKRESLGVSSFTAADAKAAGTQNMAKFARNMLFARAMSNGVKWFCPDVFNGSTVYVPEELGAEVDGEGNVIDTTARVIVGPPTGTTNGNGHNGTNGVKADDERAYAERALAMRKFHAIGTELYGTAKEWDAKRPEIVAAATKNRVTSSADLTDKELANLTEIMQKRLDAKRAELNAITLDAVPEVNPFTEAEQVPA